MERKRSHVLKGKVRRVGKQEQGLAVSSVLINFLGVDVEGGEGDCQYHDG